MPGPCLSGHSRLRLIEGWSLIPLAPGLPALALCLGCVEWGFLYLFGGVLVDQKCFQHTRSDGLFFPQQVVLHALLKCTAIFDHWMCSSCNTTCNGIR